MIQLNNYFVLILIFAISVTILAILWTLILTNIFKVNATHQGYFDDSNQMRFMTVVYALQVISKYMEIDTEGLDIQITRTVSEHHSGSVPALYANIPIVCVKHQPEYQ